MSEPGASPADQTKCPVCGEPLEGPRQVQCLKCKTPHHQDCFTYNEGCAIFACGEERYESRRTPEQPAVLQFLDTVQARPRPRQVRRRGVPLPTGRHPVYLEFESGTERLVRNCAFAGFLAIGAALFGGEAYFGPERLPDVFGVAVAVTAFFVVGWMGLSDTILVGPERRSVLLERYFFAFHTSGPLYERRELRAVGLTYERRRAGMMSWEGDEYRVYQLRLYPVEGAPVLVGEPMGNAFQDGENEAHRLAERVAAALELPCVATERLEQEPPRPSRAELREQRRHERRNRRISSGRAREDVFSRIKAVLQATMLFCVSIWALVDAVKKGDAGGLFGSLFMVACSLALLLDKDP